MAGKDIPQIGSVMGNQLLTRTTAATLWAGDVVSYYPIERVWCLVVPPGHCPDPENPVTDLPELDLTYESGSGRYEARYEGFSEQGFYEVLFYAEDVWGSISAPRKSYVKQSGYDERVILVAGGATNESAWPTINNIANQAYQTFLARKLLSTNIYYLNSRTNQDLDVDDSSDVDAPPSLASLATAVINWADNADKLTVYLIASETNGDLRLNDSEVLNAVTLDGWLDTFQSSNRPVYVILEASKSGAFIPKLIPPEDRRRIVVASAKPNKNAIMGSGWDDELYDLFLKPSFSRRNHLGCVQ